MISFRPKVSVVTISFNQANFLERTIQSVLTQEGVDIEYIIVDPGSTDGSRDLIERYRHRLSAVIFEKDEGPADGLNKGFAKATGDIFYYINSDDTLNPGAIREAVDAFERNPRVDVFCGHAWIIDENDNQIRRVWSDPFIPHAVAYGMSLQIQPSTLIRAEAFKRSGGFNPNNRSNWDGELLIALKESGAEFSILHKFMSNYRIHSSSITASGSEHKRIREWSGRRFERIMGRPIKSRDAYIKIFWFLFRQARNPAAALERLRRGPVYRRLAS